MITQAKLKELFTYDPETGVLVWNNRSSEVDHYNTAYMGNPAGCVGTGGYIYIKIAGRRYVAHRLIWTLVHGALPDGLQIDHINGDPADNRLCNLRLATQSQNQMNRHADSRRDLPKGVYANRHGGYRAETTFMGVRLSTSSHKDLALITSIQQELEMRLHGEFAVSASRTASSGAS